MMAIDVALAAFVLVTATTLGVPRFVTHDHVALQPHALF
jgi:hypothetical protein